jgi:hypothetical protein
MITAVLPVGNSPVHTGWVQRHNIVCALGKYMHRALATVKVYTDWVGGGGTGQNILCDKGCTCTHLNRARQAVAKCDSFWGRNVAERSGVWAKSRRELQRGESFGEAIRTRCFQRACSANHQHRGILVLWQQVLHGRVGEDEPLRRYLQRIATLPLVDPGANTVCTRVS